MPGIHTETRPAPSCPQPRLPTCRSRLDQLPELGRRIATRLAEEGCDVGIVDVNIEEAERTSTLVTEAGRRSARQHRDRRRGRGPT